MLNCSLISYLSFFIGDGKKSNKKKSNKKKGNVDLYFLIYCRFEDSNDYFPKMDCLFTDTVAKVNDGDVPLPETNGNVGNSQNNGNGVTFFSYTFCLFTDTVNEMNDGDVSPPEIDVPNGAVAPIEANGQLTESQNNGNGRHIFPYTFKKYGPQKEDTGYAALDSIQIRVKLANIDSRFLII